VDRLLRTGKPFKKQTNCYFIDEAGTWRWFGIFCLSDGDRVLFFPGLDGSYDAISAHARDERGLRQRGLKRMQIDHVTLEGDLRSTHLTAARSKQHFGPFPTLPLDEGRCLWFGVSVRGPQVLRSLMKQTVVVATVRATDSRRRGDEFDKVREGQVFQGLELPPGGRPQPGFLHIAVLAGPRGFPDYTGGQLGFPFGSPFVQGELQVPLNLPVRRHRISVGDGSCHRHDLAAWTAECGRDLHRKRSLKRVERKFPHSQDTRTP
jgi:hypothetical protein